MFENIAHVGRRVFIEFVSRDGMGILGIGRVNTSVFHIISPSDKSNIYEYLHLRAGRFSFSSGDISESPRSWFRITFELMNMASSSVMKTWSTLFTS